jgi:hypothetical protein
MKQWYTSYIMNKMYIGKRNIMRNQNIYKIMCKQRTGYILNYLGLKYDVSITARIECVLSK